MTPPEDIYLSVVATSRNDDHGGKIMGRMRHCFASLSEQAARYRLPIQLVLVDWNPPSDRPPLAEVPDLGASHEFFRFDVITVPPEVHAALPLANDIPLFQYYAKNVGIRRALGRFILATNVDIIFAERLAEHLGKCTLEPGRMYRSDRVDTDIGDQLDTLTPERRQEACIRNLVQIQTRYGTAPAARLAERIADRPPVELPDVLGQMISALVAELKVKMPKFDLHLTACGDFQLLAREDWARLRGYAELPIHSWHIDSLFAYQADAAGLKEEMLPPDCAAFHIHHAPGWANQGNMEGGLDVALQRDGDKLQLSIVPRDMPLLVTDEVDRFITGIRHEPRATVNNRNWGYGDREFQMVTRV
ncbi:MAG TPA: hypothetical protein VKZ79_25410 [Alphaproteobacteria bacterium]|nr:hypothetical protein [Alphaproteobacteria bacterium]